MFGFFKSKKIRRPGITQEDQEWVDKGFLWLGSIFGFDHITSRGFVTPNFVRFPSLYIGEIAPYQPLFSAVASAMDLDLNKVRINVFDDLDTLEWHHYLLENGIYNGAAGIYKAPSKGSLEHIVSLPSSSFQEASFLIGVLAHEMVHAKLLGDGIMNSRDADMEEMTDLATVFLGFGMFRANSTKHWRNGQIVNASYLPVEIMAYSLALFTWIGKQDGEQVANQLGENIRSEFRVAFNWLSEMQDTLVTQEKIEENNHLYKAYKASEEVIAQRDYATGLEVAEANLERNPKNSIAWNNVGYYKSMLGRYEEALSDLNRSVFWDAENAYAFNNRGYVYLKLGQMEKAWIDLDTGIRLLPDDGYGWRNMGLYHMELGELEQARNALEEAECVTPEAEYLHWYKGLLWERLGDLDAAISEMRLSAEQNEQEAAAWLVARGL